MKPAPFAYLRSETSDDAVARLVELGDEAKILSGGQSLVPIMNMRMARPIALVDVSRATDMTEIAFGPDRITIGAAVPQLRAELSAELASALPIVPEALSHVGHIPIRSKGTIGGSVAHADPAAEMPAVMLALGAEMKVRSRAGVRSIPASQFFETHFTTAVEADEVLVEIEVPRLSPGHGTAFLEVARRHGDFALVGAAAVVAVDAGVVRSARIVLSGVADVPWFAAAAEDAATGCAVADEEGMRAIEQAGREGLEAPTDIHASAGYREQVAGVLARRAVELAARRAEPTEAAR